MSIIPKNKNAMFIVHVEDSFKGYMSEQTIPYILCEAMKHQCDIFPLESHVDSWESCEEIQVLKEYLPYQPIHFSYNYELDMFEEDDEDNNWIIESRGHEYTWIPPEFRNTEWLKQYEHIYVTGGARHECLDDFLVVLEYLDIDYTVLVNGTY